MRLLKPLASYSGKAGEKVKAMVIASPDCDGSEIIPIGSEVEGEVRSAQRVGMGLVHETAKLKVEFRKLKFKDGSETEISARIVEIDNARETLKGRSDSRRECDGHAAGKNYQPTATPAYLESLQ